MTASTSGGTGTGPGVSRNGVSGTGELLAQQLLGDLGLRAAAGRLHDLTDEEAHQGLLARAELLGLLRVRGDDLRHDGGERAAVGDLAEAARLHDRGRIAPALARDERGEDLLGARRAERAVG